MNIVPLALILLIGRLVSELFIIMVLIRQWQIRKTKTHPRLMQMRRVLALLAILVFIGNLYPMGLDLITLFDPGIRTSQHVNLQGVFYTLDNNFTFMFASILIWVLYKLSDIVIEVAELIGAKPLRSSTDEE